MGEGTKKVIFSQGSLLLLVFTSYFLLSLVLTYPLITNLGGKLFGGEDANYALWLDWWYKQSVLIRQRSPFLWSNFLFYPDGLSLGASLEGVLFHIFGALGLVLVGNSLFVYNLLCLFSVAFSAWAVFLFTKYLKGQFWLCYLGGLAVGLAPYQMAHMISGHTNLIGFGLVPLFFLSFLKLRQNPSGRRVLLASLLLFLVGLGSWIYLFFTLLCLGFYLLFEYGLSYRGKLRLFFSWLLKTRFLIMLFITTVLLLPFVFPIIRGGLRQETVVYLGDFGAYGSADLTSFFVPSPRSNLGRILSTGRIYDHYFIYNETEATNFLGWLGILGLVLIVRRIPRSPLKERLRGEVWLYLFTVCCFLSLGPLLRIFGKVYFVLPYLLLALLPFASMARVPARLSIFALLFLVAFLIENLSGWFSRLKPSCQRVVFGVAFLVLLGERMFLPVPLFAEPTSKFYLTMAEDGADYAIVNLPLSDVNHNALANYAQTVHGKKIVGGYTSVYAVTSQVRNFIVSSPWLRHSYCRGFDEARSREVAGQQSLAAFLDTLKRNNIHYLILHKYLLDEEGCLAYKTFLESYLAGRPVYFEDDLLRVYRTD